MYRIIAKNNRARVYLQTSTLKTLVFTNYDAIDSMIDVLKEACPSGKFEIKEIDKEEATVMEYERNLNN